MFFNIRQIYFFMSVGLSVRWQKMALLVFWALVRVSAKTKCAICGSGFYTDAQLVYMYDKIIQYLLNWVDMYDYNHTKVKHKKFLQIIKAVFSFLPSIFANMW